MRYDKWQQDVINDKSKYLMICKGRQIGGTSVLAQKSVNRMIAKKTSILVGSITEEQAKLVIVMVKDILLRDHKNLIARGKNKPTLTQITTKNGSTLRSRPVGTMGDAFRGFTADINWFNEGSKWPEIAFVSIMPTLMTTGGDIWMDSTPFGKYIGGTTKKTFFFKCWENIDKTWKVYYKTSPEVINEREITSTPSTNSPPLLIGFGSSVILSSMSFSVNQQLVSSMNKPRYSCPNSSLVSMSF